MWPHAVVRCDGRRVVPKQVFGRAWVISLMNRQTLGLQPTQALAMGHLTSHECQQRIAGIPQSGGVEGKRDTKIQEKTRPNSETTFAHINGNFIWRAI